MIHILCILLSGISWAEDRPIGAKTPGGYVQVTSDQPENIPPDRDRPATITVSFLQKCTDLQIGIRGIDGLEVTDGEVRSHGECVVGTDVQREVTVKIPQNTLGHAIVDVSMKVAGMRLNESLALTFRHGKPAPKKGLGTLKKDSKGNPIRVMQASPRGR